MSLDPAILQRIETATTRFEAAVTIYEAHVNGDANLIIPVEGGNLPSLLNIASRLEGQAGQINEFVDIMSNEFDAVSNPDTPEGE